LCCRVPGSVNLAANPDVIKFVAAHDAADKLVCPICSAAARVLAGNDLLKGRRYVCSGDLWQDEKEYVDAPVVEDGNLISGKGFGHVFDFAFTVRHGCWVTKTRYANTPIILLPLVVPR
jgi:putative intracellular protease/amidase